ncbi:hypothetical protein [Robiginitalea sediminis]|uniref:hypothetical protein n=1 Tax=Robiginitalea sediminis TaxID=1982593 RepID=UPI000B4B3465|nr:hypothetical protein [Robiginitalea sediminis]
MDRFEHIRIKLEQFLTRFYLRQVLKGFFLFLFFGGVLLLGVAGLEYLLWSGTGLRMLLFWGLVLLEAYLLIRYIALPALRLLRLRKGLSHKEASRLIGTHFPEVGDRLLNLLELSESPEKSELLLASIAQRSNALKDIPFVQAAPLAGALRYARYVAVPLGMLLLLWVSGAGLDWWQSYRRVVDYKTAYEPPAPFSFRLLNAEVLRSLENETVTLRVTTEGPVQPEGIEVLIDGSPVLMEDRLTEFTYTLRPPLKDMSLQFRWGDVASRVYELRAIRVPVVDRFEMLLEYPAYLQRGPETVKGTGNAVVPEGTRIQWRLTAVHTDTLRYTDQRDTLNIGGEDGEFTFTRRASRPLAYTLTTSNEDVRDYDRLQYRVDVIRDEYPEIQAGILRDTLEPNIAYFTGTVSDDYGISRVEVWAYPTEDPEAVQKLQIPGIGGLFGEFQYTFPSGLNLEEGKTYQIQFAATDNDGLRGGKTRNSRVFTLEVLTEEALKEEKLKARKSVIDKLGGELEKQRELDRELEELQNSGMEKKELNYNDQQELRQNLDRQLQQEQQMEKFSRELNESLKEEKENDPFRDLLEERLERQELEARKNAALMEELQKVLDKLDREALQERIEEMGRKQESNRRSMEQILELTKRYYVTEKSKELARKLDELSKDQDTLGQINNSDGDQEILEQQDLKERMQKMQNELQELQEANGKLRKPMPWKRDTKKENDILDLQEGALQEIKKGTPSEENGMSSEGSTNRKQRNAARKMSELSRELGESASGGGGMSGDTAEDAEMLRQILDNLVVFSFQQEMLFNAIQQRGEGTLALSGDIRKQKELEALFRHVDDSLFALSLRKPEIGEVVNEKITDAYYNIEKGLESLSENQWYRGASYAQYVVTASNDLSALLADILENMQQSMQPGKGDGQGSDSQLQDIIMSQEQLKKQMQGNSGKQGQSGQEGGKEGKSGEEGQKGQSGQNGQEGEEGGQGNQGEGGSEGQKEGEGEGSSGGGNGDGKGNNGASGQEMDFGEIFEIYKQQQKIRNQLERELQDMINASDKELARQIAREMERFEEELLRTGITERTADRLNRIQQQLMRLENAALKQGEKEERESQSNETRFVNPLFSIPKGEGDYREELEDLNKQVLPLRRLYRNKTKAYFKENDSLPQRD